MSASLPGILYVYFNGSTLSRYVVVLRPLRESLKLQPSMLKDNIIYVSVLDTYTSIIKI